MRTNLPRRIALLEKRLVRPPEPVRVLPGEWPYGSGWAPGETCSRQDCKDRIFTPGATVAEFRRLIGKAPRSTNDVGPIAEFSSVRLSAARAILEQATKLRESGELAKRINDLEEMPNEYPIPPKVA